MTLVAYAGKDPEEPPLEVPETKFLRRQSYTRPEAAYRRFLLGASTFDLSKSYRGVREPTVLRWITAERCKRRGLPNPYEARS